ncbi:Uncharacterized protein GBIM_01927 [Gryllus bimaculatus]|nr:Uncharacterized protein GBIM_01927 [Gryllus bimaculatus]
MPFVQRVVEPVFLSRRNAASEEEENNKLLTDYELETVANTTLSNALRQLASLVLIANDIFDSLTKELEDVRDRSSKLRKRIEAVEGKVSEYDPKTVTVREYLQLFMTILQEVGVDRLSKTLPTDHSGNLRRCRGPRKTEPN